MPLKPGSSKETISTNIREFHGGKTYAHTAAKFGKKKADSQAVAVAMNTARKYRRKYADGGEVPPDPGAWGQDPAAEAQSARDAAAATTQASVLTPRREGYATNQLPTDALVGLFGNRAGLLGRAASAVYGAASSIDPAEAAARAGQHLPLARKYEKESEVYWATPMANRSPDMVERVNALRKSAWRERMDYVDKRRAELGLQQIPRSPGGAPLRIRGRKPPKDWNEESNSYMRYADGGEVLPAPSPWDQDAMAEAFRPHDLNPFSKPTRPPFQIQGPLGMEDVDPNDSPFRGFGRPEDKSYGAVHDLYTKAAQAVHRYSGPGFSQALNKTGTLGTMLAPGSGEQASMEDAVKTKEAIQEGKPGEAALHGAGSVFNATLGSMPGAAIVTKLGMPLMAMAARRRAEPTAIETPKEAIGYLRDNLQIDPKRDLGYSHHQDYVDLARYYQRESQQNGMTPKEIRWRDIYGAGDVVGNPHAGTAIQSEPILTPYEGGLALIRETAADPTKARAWEDFTTQVAERGYHPSDLPELKKIIGGTPEEFAARLYLMANSRPAIVNDIFRSLEPSFGNQVSEIMSRYHAARPGAHEAAPSREPRPADMLIEEARGAREPDGDPQGGDLGREAWRDSYDPEWQPSQADWDDLERVSREYQNHGFEVVPQDEALARQIRHEVVNQNYDSPWSTPDAVGPPPPRQSPIRSLAEATAYLRDYFGMERPPGLSARDYVTRAESYRTESRRLGMTPEQYLDDLNGRGPRWAGIDQTPPPITQSRRPEAAPPSGEARRIDDLRKQYADQAKMSDRSIQREAVPYLEKILPNYNGNIKEFLDHYYAGTFNKDSHGSGISRNYGGGLTVRTEDLIHPLTKVEIRGSAMTRTINPEAGKSYASHDYLSFPDDMQASGLTKSILKNQFELYNKMNLDHVKMHANIDVGGYAWAKYGWIPDAQSWGFTGRTVRDRANRERAFKFLTPEQADYIETLTNNPDPRTIWKIADIRALSPHKDQKGEPMTWGKFLLLGRQIDWFGKFDLKDAASMDRFNAYIAQKKK